MSFVLPQPQIDLCKHARELQNNEKLRYINKISLLKKDPYLMVFHSQSLNTKPLSTWIHIKKDATVLNGHCECAAGLGECCSHVGAILFALNGLHTNMYDKEVQSVTDVKAYWVIPSCKNSLQQCNDQIKYSKDGDQVASSTENVSDASTHGNMVNILQKFKAKGQVRVAMLGLDEFASDDDIESELLHL